VYIYVVAIFINRREYSEKYEQVLTGKDFSLVHEISKPYHYIIKQNTIIFWEKKSKELWSTVLHSAEEVVTCGNQERPYERAICK
jgi:hypothetical protein